MLDTGIRKQRREDSGLPWGWLSLGGAVAVVLLALIWILLAAPETMQVVREIPLGDVQ